MLSERQRQRVWESWLSAEIRANYAADLCQSHQRTQRAITWLTAVSSSGAAVTLLAGLPSDLTWVRSVLAIAAAALSLWSLVAHLPRRATDCADLHGRWSKLASSFEALWDDMHAADAGPRLDRLREQEDELSKSSASVLPNHRRALLKWQAHVEQHHRTTASAAV